MPPNILKKIRDEKFTETDGNLYWLKLDGSNANSNIDIGTYDFTTTGEGTFGDVTVSGASPTLNITETDAILNEKRWSWTGYAGGLDLWIFEDGGGGGKSILRFNRVGNSIDAITFGEGKLRHTSGTFDFDDDDIVTTGTLSVATDLTIGNNKVYTDATELRLRQSGDTYGATYLSIRSRYGSGGAIIVNEDLDLTTFGLQSSSGAQMNIRMEHRGAYMFGTGNSNGEIQFMDLPLHATNKNAPMIVGKGTVSIGAPAIGTWGESNTKLGVGTAIPATSAKLEISSTTGALLLPRMTTAQRNALTAVNGMIIYNTTTTAFNFYENGAWIAKADV